MTGEKTPIRGIAHFMPVFITGEGAQKSMMQCGSNVSAELPRNPIPKTSLFYRASPKDQLMGTPCPAPHLAHVTGSCIILTDRRSGTCKEVSQHCMTLGHGGEGPA
jgi:hypothetical protein